jgi:hypothetical protein
MTRRPYKEYDNYSFNELVKERERVQNKFLYDFRPFLWRRAAYLDYMIEQICLRTYVKNHPRLRHFYCLGDDK